MMMKGLKTQFENTASLGLKYLLFHTVFLVEITW